MAELMEVFEMVTKQTEPDLDAWKQQEDRQRRNARKRKAGAFVAVAAIAAAIVLLFVATRPSTDVGTGVAHHGSQGTAPSLTPGLDRQDRAIVELDGSVTAIVPGLPEDAFGLSLSADGSTIAFVMVSDGENHIATIGIDGQGMRILGPGSQPAISPDASRIVFVRDYDLYVMNADGSGVQRIVGNPHVDEFPAWSPDGTTIAYDHYASKAPTDSGFSEGSSIVVVPATGGDPTTLRQGATSGEPTFSPDGAQIAFRSDNAIMVMDADGANVHTVTSDAGTPNGLRWSPDGTKIAFSAYNGDYRPVLHLGVDGGDWALGDVRYVDVSSGKITDVGVQIATWFNAPNWLPASDALLVNAVQQT